MVKIHAKKHDNYSVEFKFGFEDNEGLKDNRFAVNSWIFLPNSIGINPESYGKDQFYRDVKSNVRLITPRFSLKEISSPDALPLSSVRKAMVEMMGSEQNMDAYEYHLKMFAAIFKSAIREAEHQIRGLRDLSKADSLCVSYCQDISKITSSYRSLYPILKDTPENPRILGYYKLVDEFISYASEMRTLRIIKKLDSRRHSHISVSTRDMLVRLVNEEKSYKQKHHYAILSEDAEHNRQVVYHHGMLKKFVESDLYINLDKKKDGVAVEQIYYSIAAGVAMIFATAVGWATQLRYGNITWPLFIVLVISYMLKDRIKELMRFYFAHKLGNKYYDKKAKIQIGSKDVGIIKEGVDFISFEKTPQEVLKLRNVAATVDDASRIFDEKVLLYRKRVSIDSEALKANNEYPVRGINEIMRLHLTRFSQKMDNPEVPVNYLSGEGTVNSVKVQKIYYINIVFQLCQEDDIRYCHFRISMTRDGIVKVEEL